MHSPTIWLKTGKESVRIGLVIYSVINYSQKQTIAILWHFCGFWHVPQILRESSCFKTSNLKSKFTVLLKRKHQQACGDSRLLKELTALTSIAPTTMLDGRSGNSIPIMGQRNSVRRWRRHVKISGTIVTKSSPVVTFSGDFRSKNLVHSRNNIYDTQTSSSTACLTENLSVI